MPLNRSRTVYSCWDSMRLGRIPGVREQACVAHLAKGTRSGSRRHNGQLHELLLLDFHGKVMQCFRHQREAGMMKNQWPQGRTKRGQGAGIVLMLAGSSWVMLAWLVKALT